MVSPLLKLTGKIIKCNNLGDCNKSTFRYVSKSKCVTNDSKETWVKLEQPLMPMIKTCQTKPMITLKK